MSKPSFGKTVAFGKGATRTPKPVDTDSGTAQASPDSDALDSDSPNPGTRMSDATTIDYAVETLGPIVAGSIDEARLESSQRDEIAEELAVLVTKLCEDRGIDLNELEQRDVTTVLLNDLIGTKKKAPSDPLITPSKPTEASSNFSKVDEAKERIQPLLMEQIDVTKASELSRQDLAEQIGEIVSELLVQERFSLNLREQRDLVTRLLNDMLGLGPLEPLLADNEITDILVNGKDQVYIERHGKLELTDVTFRNDQHLMNVCTRIVSGVGRRVDETMPLCDARLMDGSRVNIIIPPLAIDGASISIRKFSEQKITLDVMVETGNISAQMAQVMKIASACRLNILISGGTGSGKTTLLNAMSQMIDHTERIVTIEDAAELQMQQPHTVRLETRPANLEGDGEITMRDLVKNALRMRPDRVILGEIRSSEAVDMLQAMNTGHDGSMCTVHANTPRDSLMRLENMVGMAGINLPTQAVRTQIASALDMIVQIARMRDGVRRIKQITEVVGMEGDVITTQDLFTYEFKGEDEHGKLRGEWISSGIRPHFMDKAEYYGLERALADVI